MRFSAVIPRCIEEGLGDDYLGWDEQGEWPEP